MRIQTSPNAQGMMGGGSGTVFAYDRDTEMGICLTNHHVVEGAIDRPITVTYPGGKPLSGRVLATDRARDLAMVAFRAPPDAPRVNIASTPPAVGEDVWQAGYPMGRGPIQRGGKWRGAGGRVNGNGRVVYSVTFPVASGDSGSGVFNAKHELVAVVWGSGGDTAAVGLEDVHAFVESHKLACFVLPWRRQIEGRLGSLEANRQPAIPPRAPAVPAPTQPPSAAPAPSHPTYPAPSQPSVAAAEIAQLRSDLQTWVSRLEAQQSGLGQRIGSLESDVAALKVRPAAERGPAGPAGPQGPTGERGPAGPAGKGHDGKEIELIREELKLLREQLKLEFRVIPKPN